MSTTTCTNPLKARQSYFHSTLPLLLLIIPLVLFTLTPCPPPIIPTPSIQKSPLLPLPYFKLPFLSSSPLHTTLPLYFTSPSIPTSHHLPLHLTPSFPASHHLPPHPHTTSLSTSHHPSPPHTTSLSTSHPPSLPHTTSLPTLTLPPSPPHTTLTHLTPPPSPPHTTSLSTSHHLPLHLTPPSLSTPHTTLPFLTSHHPPLPSQVSIDLGVEYRFHSVFACPILRQQTTSPNLPVRLVCGHAISMDAAKKLVMHTGRLKCPYCPMEMGEKEILVIHF